MEWTLEVATSNSAYPNARPHGVSNGEFAPEFGGKRMVTTWHPHTVAESGPRRASYPQAIVRTRIRNSQCAHIAPTSTASIRLRTMKSPAGRQRTETAPGSA